MNCFVTGGSGFLGSHVADELTKNGHNVIIFYLVEIQLQVFKNIVGQI